MESNYILARNIAEIAIREGDTSRENLQRIYFSILIFAMKKSIKEKYMVETGIWKTVQELVITHNQPAIARQICQENGIDGVKARLLQLASDRWHKEMKQFIEELN